MLGPAPTQQHLDNTYIMCIYSPEYYPYCRLLLGGGSTQSLCKDVNPVVLNLPNMKPQADPSWSTSPKSRLAPSWGSYYEQKIIFPTESYVSLTTLLHVPMSL